jgi:integrase
MRGHIAKKRDRFYIVFDVGHDPSTGKRKQRWHSGPDRKGYISKRVAERAMRQLLTSVDNNEYVDPTTITVGTYLLGWLDSLRLRPSTLSIYRVQVQAYVVPRIGSVLLQRLTPEILKTLYAELERGGGKKGQPLSAKTVSNVHRMLHRALDRAVQRSLIARNPARLVEKPKPKRHEIRPWSPSETSRFLSAAEDDRLHAAFVLMATAGLRRGEALGLRWDDVDLDRGALSVRRALVLVANAPTFNEPKTEAGRRSVPLASQTVAALKTHRKRQAEERLAFADVYVDQGLVFAREDGSPIHPERFLDAFHRISKVAGLRPTRPHDLRQGWASRALEAGVPVRAVQEILGHASAMTTLDVYQHVGQGVKTDAAQLVADLVAKR